MIGRFGVKVIIDRFEGEYAVVEMPDRSMVDVPRVLFGGAKVGDVVNITVDSEETQLRKADVGARFRNLFE